MIRVVFDCNVVLAGIGWNGSARRCLKLVATRHVFLYATEDILVLLLPHSERDSFY